MTATVAADQVGTARRVWLRMAVGAFLSAGAIYAVVTAAGGFADALHALGHVKVGWLVLAAGWEVVSYACLGVLMRELSGQRRVSRRSGMRLGLVVLGLGNVLPAAPVEGLTLAGHELKRRDVSPRRIALALGFFQWFITRAMFAFFALSALAVVVGVQDRRLFPLVGGRVALGLIAAAVLLTMPLSRWFITRRSVAERIALLVGRLQRRSRRRTAAEQRAIGAAWHRDAMALLGRPRHQATLTGLALLWCACDATCFRLCLEAAGVPVSAAAFVLGYATAMLGAMVPFVPAGLGAVETAVPALLHRTGVPVATALAGVLTFRLLSTLLPALAGVVALVGLRRAPVHGEAEAGSLDAALLAVEGAVETAADADP